MGCIEGLRQYDYGGQLTLIMNNDNDYEFPYKHDKLHKGIINMKKGKKIKL